MDFNVDIRRLLEGDRLAQLDPNFADGIVDIASAAFIEVISLDYIFVSLYDG